MKKTAGRRSFYALFCLRAGRWVLRRPGGEQVLRLRARDGVFRAPARVTFFCCQKKVTKENHSNLRFKNPLARYGLCKIGGAGFAELARRETLSVRGIACTSCAAAADSSEGRSWCAGRVEGLGDKKKRPGALLLALFISFWRCRSGRSETGATGRRRGLRRGRRSWENPWHRRP